MARRKRGAMPEEDEPEMDISSLIDVCFLLLIYFLVTSTIQPKEQDLPMNIPSESPPDTKVEIEPMLIRVDAVGKINVNKTEDLDEAVSGKERVYEQLQERLNSYAETCKSTGKEPLVQIWVAGDVPQKHVVDVLNALKGASINSMTFKYLEAGD